MAPAEISAFLGLQPDRAWRAGDPRTTPKNTPLEGVWRDTCWAAEILDGKCPDKSIAGALEELIEQFQSYREFFHKIRSEAGRVEFYVSWFIDGKGRVAMVLLSNSRTANRRLE